MQLKASRSIVFVAALALSSCNSTRWTKSQAATLPSVALGFPSKKADSYHKPVKLSPQGSQMGNSVAFATGLAGGFIGGAIGAAVVTGVAAADQKAFEGANTEQIGRIETSLDHRIEKDYAKRLEPELKKIPFFASRLRKDSPHVIDSTIVRYGLSRVNNGDPMRFRAVVVVQVSLTGTGGTALLKNAGSSGTSSMDGTLSDFAYNKKFLDKAFQEASVNAAENLGKLLRMKVEKVAP